MPPPSTAPAALDCIVVGQQPRGPLVPGGPAPAPLQQGVIDLSDDQDEDDDDLDLGTVHPRAYQRHFVALLDEPEDDDDDLEGLLDAKHDTLIPEQFDGGMDREIEQGEVLDVALARFERGQFEEEGEL